MMKVIGLFQCSLGPSSRSIFTLLNKTVFKFSFSLSKRQFPLSKLRFYYSFKWKFLSVWQFVSMGSQFSSSFSRIGRHLGGLCNSSQLSIYHRQIRNFILINFLAHPQLWWFERILLTYGINLKQLDFGWIVVTDPKAKKIIQLLVLYPYIMKQVL